MDEQEQRRQIEAVRQKLIAAYDQLDACVSDSATAPDANTELLAELESDWQNIATQLQDSVLRRQSTGYVLAEIAHWVENLASYPPPELLIAFAALFGQYMGAEGRLTLEEVFFGRPKQRLGSYAKRCKADSARAFHGIPFALEFHKAKKVLRMTSDAKAAAYAQKQVEANRGNCPDSETMLKRMRRRRTK